MSKVWNVVLPVIALVEADTVKEAEAKLRLRLAEDAFDVYESLDDRDFYPTFEAEDGTQPNLT